MIKKIIFLLLITLFINQCGYQKVYSNKNINLSINKIKKENNLINNEISNMLLSIISNKSSENNYDLEIQSNKNTEIRTKNSKGDPSVYVLKLKTKVTASNSENNKYEKVFYKEMNYNNNDDKFQLSQYIVEIEKILIKETVDEIISYLIAIR